MSTQPINTTEPGHLTSDRSFKPFQYFNNDGLETFISSYCKTDTEAWFARMISQWANYDLFCTLTFKCPVNYKQAYPLFKKWLRRIEQSLKGLGIVNNEIKFVVVAPKPSQRSQIHIHALLANPALRCPAVQRKIPSYRKKWENLRTSRSAYHYCSKKSLSFHTIRYAGNFVETGDARLSYVYDSGVFTYMSKHVRYRNLGRGAFDMNFGE